MDEVTIDAQTDTAIVGHWRDLFMTRARGRYNASSVAVCAKQLDRFARQQTGKFGYLVIIEPDTDIPDKSARRAVDQMVVKHLSRYHFASLVIEEGGTRGVLVRSILTLVGLAAGKKHPESIHSGIEEASGWMCSRYRDAGVCHSCEEIRAALRAFRIHGDIRGGRS